MAKKVGSIYTEIRARLNKLEGDYNRAHNMSRNSARKMQGSFDKLNFKKASASFNKFHALIAAGGIAIAARSLGRAFKNIVTTGAEFEKEMRIVGGVARATKKEFKDLESIARTMGATTEFTAGQAAGGLRFLAMAGFDAKKAIAALPGTLDLATAGNIDLSMAADLATNALTAMRLPVEQLSRVNDSFIATITRTNTNIEQMAEAFRYAAPKGQAFGYTIEELSTLIGLLGNAGIQGSMAGTQLSFAMGKVHKIFEQLGLSGEGKNLIDALRAINKAQWDTNKIMQVFGERGGRAALVLKSMTGDYENLLEKIKDAEGESGKLADTMRSTTIGAFKELTSAMADVKITIFNILQKDIQQSTKDLTTLTRGIGAIATAFESFRKSSAFFPTMMRDFFGIMRQMDPVIALFRDFNAAVADSQRIWAAFEGVVSRTFGKIQTFFNPAPIEDFDAAVENWGDEAVHAADNTSAAFLRVGETINKAAESTKNLTKESDNLKKSTAEWIGILAKRDAQVTMESELKKLDELTRSHERAAKKITEDAEKNSTENVNMRVDKGLEDYFGEIDKMADELSGKSKWGEKLIDLSERTAYSMQRNFSDLFFDAMEGKLNSMTDYWEAFVSSIHRMISDLAAQSLVEAMFGTLKSGMAGGGGGWMGALFGSATTAAAVAHSGGIVGQPGPSRMIPSGAYARRLHNGLRSDEVLTILQKGEGVASKQAMQSAGGPSGARPIIVNNYIQTTGDGSIQPESLNQLNANVGTSISRAMKRNG